MKRIISILLLLILIFAMVTSCSKLGSRRYVLDVLDAMDKGDDERFYKLLEDESYDINRNPNLLIDRIVFFFPCVDNPLEKACRLERYDYVEALINSLPSSASVVMPAFSFSIVSPISLTPHFIFPHSRSVKGISFSRRSPSARPRIASPQRSPLSILMQARNHASG